MILSKRIAPPHSLVLLADIGGGSVPRSLEDSLIAATDSCIAVGCRSEIDGATEFVLGLINEVNSGDEPKFVGYLKTPSFVVSVQSVYEDIILKMDVFSETTPVCIWANDAIEPTKVIIGIGSY